MSRILSIYLGKVVAVTPHDADIDARQEVEEIVAWPGRQQHCQPR
jgi:hypothetical protein